MTKKIFYEKQGRRYIPVAEYDRELFDSLPKGSHLITCDPNGVSRRYNINPAHAPLIAAGRIAEESMTTALIRASEVRPTRQPLTPEEHAAWQNLIAVWGSEARSLNHKSAADIAREGIQALMAESEKLLSHPSVRAAYEQFLMVCELVKNHNEPHD